MMGADLAFIESEVHRRLLREVLDDARRDPHVIGVMLTGSLARGDAYPGSDLDVHVLLRDGCSRAFCAELRRGILVECSYADEARARSRLERDPMHVYAYLDGRILYDPEGRLQVLLSAATARFEAYRVPDEEAHGIAHWLHSARTKIVAARDAGDELRAAYVTGTSSWEMLRGIWAACGKPVPPSGALWAHLRDLPAGPPDIEAWLRRLFAGDTGDRISAAIEIIDWVLPQLAERVYL
jgi:predicted nucleotidyltransferase